MTREERNVLQAIGTAVAALLVDAPAPLRDKIHDILMKALEDLECEP